MERAQTQPYFVYMKRFILFVTYLFDLGFVLKFQFSFVIYIYIIFTFYYLAEAFIQSDLQMRRIEAIKPTKEQWYASATLIYYYSVIFQFHI